MLPFPRAGMCYGTAHLPGSCKERLPLHRCWDAPACSETSACLAASLEILLSGPYNWIHLLQPSAYPTSSNFFGQERVCAEGSWHFSLRSCWTGGTAGSSCRLAPSLAGSLWGFSPVGKETLFMGSRWVACCSWGSTERAQHYKSSSACTITSEQPYTSRKGQTDQIVFPFSTIFLIGLGRMDKCLERAVSFHTSGASSESLLLHLWDTLGCQSHSHTAGAAAKGKCCGSPQTALLFCEHHMQTE